MESLLQYVLSKINKISEKLDIISERLSMVRNEMSYLEKNNYISGSSLSNPQTDPSLNHVGSRSHSTLHQSQEEHINHPL